MRKSIFENVSVFSSRSLGGGPLWIGHHPSWYLKLYSLNENQFYWTGNQFLSRNSSMITGFHSDCIVSSTMMDDDLSIAGPPYKLPGFRIHLRCAGIIFKFIGLFFNIN